jgi:hypothetical protein
MRHALYCVLLVLCAAVCGLTEPIVSGLTVILDFKGPHAASAVMEMQRESERIMKASGLRLAWRLRDDVAATSFDDLVVVQFQGSRLVPHRARPQSF